MGLWTEFKKFAFKGNVVDMAVGVVVGGAFSKIVTSLVNDIIMPPIGALTGGTNFTDLKWVLVEADEAAGIAEAAINYGSFIQTVVDFFLIALSVFLFVKLRKGCFHESGGGTDQCGHPHPEYGTGTTGG